MHTEKCLSSFPNPIGWVPKQDSVTLPGWSANLCVWELPISPEPVSRAMKGNPEGAVPQPDSRDLGALVNTEREEKTVRRTGMGEWPPPHNHTWYCRKVIPNATLIYSSLRFCSRFLIISSHSFIYRSTNVDCILLDHGEKSVVISLSGQI